MTGNPTGSVMVVGAGIAGIQASLDLADAGYLVYLVEKDTAIGGVMAQLDKTFPTNDCSMCIISPKLVEAGRHLNIELMPMTTVNAVNGSAGDFTVGLTKAPRFIDMEKCTACGECHTVCPVELPNPFDEGLSSKRAAFKLYPQAMPSAFSIDKGDRAPCKLTCPAGLNVQGYVQMVKQGNYKKALEIIMEQLPRVRRDGMAPEGFVDEVLRPEAARRVGEEALAASLDSPWVTSRLTTSAEVYHRTPNPHTAVDAGHDKPVPAKRYVRAQVKSPFGKCGVISTFGFQRNVVTQSTRQTMGPSTSRNDNTVSVQITVLRCQPDAVAVFFQGQDFDLFDDATTSLKDLRQVLCPQARVNGVHPVWCESGVSEACVNTWLDICNGTWAF